MLVTQSWSNIRHMLHTNIILATPSKYEPDKQQKVYQ